MVQRRVQEGGGQISNGHVDADVGTFSMNDATWAYGIVEDSIVGF